MERILATTLALSTALAGCAPNVAPAMPPNANHSAHAEPGQLLPSETRQPRPDADLSGTTPIENGARWITVRARTKQFKSCLVDMRHTIDFGHITETRGIIGSSPCSRGDRIQPGQLPKDYDVTLQNYRANWEDILTRVDDVIQDKKDETTIATDSHAWVVRVGNLATGKNAYYDGDEGRDYGPDTCSIGDSDDPARASSLHSYGTFITEQGASYRVASVSDDNGMCKTGNIVLLNPAK